MILVVRIPYGDPVSLSHKTGRNHREAGWARSGQHLSSVDVTSAPAPAVLVRTIPQTGQNLLPSESRQTDFPSLADRAYLNTAAEGIPPRAVLDALARYGEDRLLGMDGRLKHEVVYEQAKSAVAQAYGLSAAEIGICSCTSEAYNLAALALHLEPGDEVIINDLDFPSGATAWLQPSCAAEARVWRAR